MIEQAAEKFQKHFGQLEDPRIERKKLYSLQEILLVILCGSVCGAESWRDFVMFGEEKLDFLRQYFAYSAGIPCKNTFARVLGALDPQQFRTCFVAWAASLKRLSAEIIAIDGKTLCNSADAQAKMGAIHMVSAFATESRLVLAQQKVAEKSNEITAIPVVLDMLDIKGHTVTIDAMGCQRNIAEKIQDKGADYVLALKGNQGTLNEDVRLFFQTNAAHAGSSTIFDTHTESDAGHGRVEQRRCIVSEQLDWLTQKPQWKGLKSIAMIEETRDVNGKISIDRRFFISSLPANAQYIAAAVRAHWAIENTLHWTLDVVCNEDQSRVRKDHAPQNMAIVRHVVLNMLNNAKKHFKGIGVKAMRKKAGWGNENLRLILEKNF